MSAHALEVLAHDYGRTGVLIPGGVDLARFAPTAGARSRLGLPENAVVLMFAGRIQPLKAPDVLLRAVGRLLERDPGLRPRLVVPVVGGPSGSGVATTVTLGAVAAPMLAKVGYSKDEAGGLLAAESTRMSSGHASSSSRRWNGPVTRCTSACRWPSVPGCRAASTRDSQPR